MKDDGTIELDLNPESVEQEETLEEQCQRMKSMLSECGKQIDRILEMLSKI